MKFEYSKRALLAGLSFVVPIPLPFNEVLSWPVLLLYWGGVGLFLWRTLHHVGEPLPSWAMNVLGLAYLPVLFLDVTMFWQGRLLRPLIHLALFLLVVKLFGMKREKDKWHIFLLIFFLFVAAMGSSVHPAAILYLALFLASAMFVLARFAAFHVLAETESSQRDTGRPTLRGFVTASTIVTLLGSIPLFAVLPRFGTPYVVGPVGGVADAVTGVGSLERLTLDVIGRVRTSSAVVLRLAYETPPPVNHEMRLRGGVFDQFEIDGWRRGPRQTEVVRRGRDGFFSLAPGRAKSWARIWLDSTAGSELVLLPEVVSIDVRTPVVHRDSNGVVTALGSRGRESTYRVGMADSSRLGFAQDAATAEPATSAIDLTGVTPRIAELAARVAGTGSDAEKAQSIEEFLQERYQYTLDLVGTTSRHPVEDFLFEWSRGHCEYFASSMVVMLRSIGIDARLVTGFLGGEFNPLEGYFVVRQSNAHAWVEARLDDGVWVTFDPTPPEGWPSQRRSGWTQLAGQIYDWIIFRWDRHVLGFGFLDQLGLARQLAELWSDLWGKGVVAPDFGNDTAVAESLAAMEDAETASRGYSLSPLAWGPLTIMVLAGAGWLWTHRPRFSADRAFRRLRGRAEKVATGAVRPSTPPLAIARCIGKVKPAAAAPSSLVVDFYLRESFGGHQLDESERKQVEAALRVALRRLRESA